ncbi:diphthine synthase [Candidatus Woesearchaeota archaeon]|nr:diphthine synthase [Candidatus Woesearchaeota archaeon]
MTLTLIGLGLNDEKDITLKGLEAIKNADIIYLESYTSILQTSFENLEKFYGKKITLANRDVVENKAEQTILKDAKTKNVAFLVIGDIFGATTHTDLVLRAKQQNIEVKYVHNTSILTAVGETGLQLYKFGKTTSIPFDNHNVEAPYNVVKQNKSLNMHTLILLDLNPEQNKFLTINQAIEYFLRMEEKKKENVINNKTIFIACARLGSSEGIIKAGTEKQLPNIDFGKPPYCLIIPGDLHFLEEEFLEMFKAV